MSGSTNLRPTATVAGVIVGVTAFEYDMRDQGGSLGTSYRLVIAEFDEDDNLVGVHRPKIPTQIAPKVRDFAAFGVPVVANLTGFAKARNGGRSADIEWSIGQLVDEAGAIIAEFRRAA